MTYTVGCVPYLNAKPLVRQFYEEGPASPVQVVFDVPSLLPGRLRANHVQAIMVSSIEALRTPTRVADGVSISTRADVVSVRLFSRVPIESIESLALDASSMTSNALAQIILAERYGVRPSLESALPSAQLMLERADACILIGDNGMRASSEGLHVLDLGREWVALTGLPFVWAMWVGGAGLDRTLAEHLRGAARYGMERLDEVVPWAAAETGFTEAQCRHYLAEIMDYGLADDHKAGLAEFGRKLVAHGLLPAAHTPEFVS